MNAPLSADLTFEGEQAQTMDQLLAERSILLKKIQDLQSAHEQALQRIDLLATRLEQTIQDVWRFQGKRSACELFLAADRLHDAWKYKTAYLAREWLALPR